MTRCDDTCADRFLEARNRHDLDGAVEAWVKPRTNEVERIRTSMHEIADTGLTLSKLAVAASLLGDLARG